MTKHISLTYTSGPWVGNTLTLNGDTFAQLVRNPRFDLRDAPSGWMYAGLLAFTDAGEVQLSPRGEDLLASIDLMPDDPPPEPEKKPCRDCNGTGEQALFVSKHVCDGCGGTGDERDRLRRRAKPCWPIPYEPLVKGASTPTGAATDDNHRPLRATATMDSDAIQRALRHVRSLSGECELALQVAGLSFRWADVQAAWRDRFGCDASPADILVFPEDSHSIRRTDKDCAWHNALGDHLWADITDGHLWNISAWLARTHYLAAGRREQLTTAICELVWRGLISGERIS